MAAITKPASLKIKRITPTFKAAISRATSPFDYSSQSQDWGGRTRQFTITFIAQKGADRIAAIGFIEDLADGDNHFVLDVSRYVHTSDPDKTAMNLRLAQNTVSSEIDEGLFCYITIEVEKDI